MVGRQLLGELSESGSEVFATWFSNPPAWPQLVTGGSVEWRYFPTSVDEWEELLLGTDVLVHLANKLWNYSAILARPNGPVEEETEKNRTILAMAKRFQVKKLIWISSAVGYGEGTSRTEDTFFDGHSGGPYQELIRTVRSFEKALQRGHQGLDIRIFRPTTIIGPPARPSSSSSHIMYRSLTALIRRQRAKVFLPDLPRNYLYVGDLCKLLKQEAVLVPEAGIVEAYNIGGNFNWTLSEIVLEAAKQLGIESNSVEFHSSAQKVSITNLPVSKIHGRHELRASSLQTVVAVTLERLQEFEESGA